MSLEIPTQNQLNELPLPTYQVAENIHGFEQDRLTSADQAAAWLEAASYRLNNVEGVTRQHQVVGGRENDYNPATSDTYVFEDDLGSEHSFTVVTGRPAYNVNKMSTAISFSTPIGDKRLTSGVFRDNVYDSVKAPAPEDTFAYSVIKYDDSNLDAIHDLTLTRTQPGELSEEGVAAAEKKYIEMANQLKIALELKLAQDYPYKAQDISGMAEDFHHAMIDAKKQAAAKNVKRLGLFKR